MNNNNNQNTVLGSHNAWTFLTPKKWWMKLIRFTAKCQAYTIQGQYAIWKSRCFDLRVRFNDKGELVVAHGIIEYDYNKEQLIKDLTYLNEKTTTVYVRVIHEVRNNKQNTTQSIELFKQFCKEIETTFQHIKFFCGMDVMPQPTTLYNFNNNPTCQELYASVTKPYLLDDWFPWIYAITHNKKNIKKGTDKDILLIDFVNIQ